MMELTDQNFKRKIVNMLKDLKKNMNTMKSIKVGFQDLPE